MEKVIEMTAKGEKQLIFRIPFALHKQFKVKCALCDKTMNEVIEEFVRSFVENEAESDEGTNKQKTE